MVTGNSSKMCSSLGNRVQNSWQRGKVHEKDEMTPNRQRKHEAAITFENFAMTLDVNGSQVQKVGYLHQLGVGVLDRWQTLK